MRPVRSSYLARFEAKTKPKEMNATKKLEHVKGLLLADKFNEAYEWTVTQSTVNYNQVAWLKIGMYITKDYFTDKKVPEVKKLKNPIPTVPSTKQVDREKAMKMLMGIMMNNLDDKSRYEALLKWEMERSSGKKGPKGKKITEKKKAPQIVEEKKEPQIVEEKISVEQQAYNYVDNLLSGNDEALDILQSTKSTSLILVPFILKRLLMRVNEGVTKEDEKAILTLPAGHPLLFLNEEYDQMFGIISEITEPSDDTDTPVDLATMRQRILDTLDTTKDFIDLFDKGEFSDLIKRIEAMPTYYFVWFTRQLMSLLPGGGKDLSNPLFLFGVLDHKDPLSAFNHLVQIWKENHGDKKQILMALQKIEQDEIKKLAGEEQKNNGEERVLQRGEDDLDQQKGMEEEEKPPEEEEEADLTYFLAHKDRFPETKEDPRFGYALTQHKLPVWIETELKLIEEKHKDEPFVPEHLDSLIQIFRNRGARMSDNKEITGNDNKEEKLRPLSDQVILLYSSQIKEWLIDALDRHPAWHPPVYETKLAAMDPGIKDGDFAKWMNEPARVRIRTFYRAQWALEHGMEKQLSEFMAVLANLSFYPDAILHWSANLIFRGIKRRVMTWRKLRLEERLQKTVIIVRRPVVFLDGILEGFFYNTSTERDNKKGRPVAQVGVRLFVALLLACGRRPSDIYHEGCFRPLPAIADSPIDGWDRYECDAITGLKPGTSTYKKKGIIPLLVPFGMFMNGLHRFRKMRGHMNMDNTRNWNSDAINTVLEPWRKKGGLVQPVEPFRFGARDLRAMYARYTVAIFGANRHYNLWIKSVLMHTHVSTSLNYSRIIFPRDNFERVPKWRFGMPKLALKNALQTLLINAVSVASKKSIPWTPDLRQRKCLGMSLEEILDQPDVKEKKDLHALITRLWDGDFDVDEKEQGWIKDLETQVAVQDEDEPRSNEDEKEEEEEEPRTSDDEKEEEEEEEENKEPAVPAPTENETGSETETDPEEE